jgi:UDP-glucose 4-epimerase
MFHHVICRMCRLVHRPRPRLLTGDQRGGKSTKALITGGAGFIGSHLAEALLEREVAVVALDDLSTGHSDNIGHLVDRPGFQFVHGSVLDAAAVDEAARGCDHVYHLAAAVGVQLIFDQPVRTIETNVRGTSVVLNTAARLGTKTFLASTSEVYGHNAHGTARRFKETDDIVLGRSMRWSYAGSKAVDEYLGRAYHVDRGLPVVIGRFFNTVGPRQSGAYGMAVPRFVQQALAGQPITVYGDGSQVRSFTWVKDAVGATVALMSHPDAVGGIFNIGSDETISIGELAERVKALTGSSSRIVHVPYRDAHGPDFEDTRYRVADISKLASTIGYHPTMRLDAMLQEVITYFRERDGGETR